MDFTNDEMIEKGQKTGRGSAKAASSLPWQDANGAQVLHQGHI